MVDQEQGIDRAGKKASLGPLLMVIFALALGLLYLPIAILLPELISLEFFSLYSLISFLGAMVAPLLFILGVMFMDHERRIGLASRARLSTVGGISLILGAVFGIGYFVYSVSNIMWNDIQSYQAVNFVTLLLLIVGIAGSLIGSYYALKRRSFMASMMAGALSTLLMFPIWPLALIPIALSRQEFETEGSWSRKKSRMVMVGVAIVVIMLVLALLMPVLGQLGDGLKLTNDLPVHDGDVIIWSVSGDLGGEVIDGTSTWTFSNTTSHPEAFMGINATKNYHISIHAVINGKTVIYYTAGAYNDNKLWSLGINPTKASEIGYSGYYNTLPLTFSHYEVIDTVFGPKNTSAYYEVFGDGSGDFWGMMWIDAENGMPYRITMNEPATLSGYLNDFRGNVTYELVSTTIVQ